MSERQPCIRCERGIDAWAKICPFCNWDQSRPAPTQPTPQPIEVAQYTPPNELNLKKKAMYAAGGLVALILAFVIGFAINQDDAPKVAPQTVEEQLAAEKAAGPIKRADTPLEPVNEPGGIEQPITSAPVAAQPGAAPNDWQRTDATAVSATEYAEMARRAKAEKERMAALVDPRSLTGPAYAQAPRAVRRQPTQLAQNGVPPLPGSSIPVQPGRRSLRTRPVPEYQPLPQLYAHGTAKLSLLVGADGRVKRIDIERPLQRDTARLISSIQSWRFRPATENGQPVAAPYSVEISFRP